MLSEKNNIPTFLRAIKINYNRVSAANNSSTPGKKIKCVLSGVAMFGKLLPLVILSFLQRFFSHVRSTVTSNRSAEATRVEDFLLLPQVVEFLR